MFSLENEQIWPSIFNKRIFQQAISQKNLLKFVFMNQVGITFVYLKIEFSFVCIRAKGKIQYKKKFLGFMKTFITI